MKLLIELPYRILLWSVIEVGSEVKMKIVRMILESSGYTAMDITGYVNEVIKSHGVAHGLAHIFTPEKRCSVTLIEYEPELLA
ncbi:MAG: hypothetical protein RMI45_06390, partial [Ignisphaera sp.]|nr:YjbQ family protein [Ignisphaera sp.]MDW8085852.1 hypothetical protein [Ignisphaera sp.]